MSSIEKSNISNLEDVNDFGNSELNKLFISLDEETKNKILKISKKEIQISVLKKVQDIRLKTEYDMLSKKIQKELDNLPIKDKYQILEEMLEAQIKKKDLSKPKVFEPKTPDESLPSHLIKIAIIIPFRDSEKSKPRTKQLNRLVEYMNSYLADYNYKIFVIEQSNDKRKFNRGQLLNIGFKLFSILISISVT